MGKQIIKQPNGKYCLFSSVVDDVTIYDATPEELIDSFVEEERKRITNDVLRIVNELEAGEKAYYQFTLSFKEMLTRIAEVHGNKHSKEVQKLLEK